MATSDAELEAQLMEAGNKLLDPPSSAEEILPLLDEVESCLSRVDQSPTVSMQSALAPSLKAMIDERLFKHTDADVKVAVASCISEITRITAPEAPYSDDQMRDVFQLIVSSFGDLADNTSRSFNKRTVILETVAKVRSCVVMLDLECDALIIEMFQLFLNSIRDYHQESVFSSMEMIMTLVLEESEEISVELLSPILASLRKDNKEVLPIARKLGEKVIEKCASKLEPYLTQAVKSLGKSIDNYSGVVASICPDVPETVEQNDGRAADEKKIDAPSEEIPEAVQEIVVDGSTEKHVEPANVDTRKTENEDTRKTENEDTRKTENEDTRKTENEDTRKTENEDTRKTENEDTPKTENEDTPKAENEDTPKAAVSNGVSQTQEDKSVASNSSKKHGDEDGSELPNDDDTAMKTESQNLDVESAVDTKEKKVPGSNKPTEPTGSSDVGTGKGEQLPDVKTDAKDLSVSSNIDSPVESAPPGEKKKEAGTESSLPKDMEMESETIISPSLSENIPEKTISKKGKRSKKKARPTKNSAPSGGDAPKKTSDEDSDSEGKSSKRHGKKGSEPIGEDNISSLKDTLKKDRSTSSKTEEKPIKPSSKKIEPGSGNGDQSSSKQAEDKKHGSRGKAVAEGDGAKSSSKDSTKEKLSSLKTDSKSMKDVKPAKETPKADLKRKHTPDSSKGYGQEVVGEKVKVWWPKDRAFYAGKIKSFDSEKGKHTIVYNDGDVEVLNLKRQRFEFVGSETETNEEDAPVHDDSDLDASSDRPLKKKFKMNHDQSKKKVKSDVTPKQSIGASSAKSKSASSKSAPKAKGSSITDGKLLDGMESDETMEDVVGSKSKDQKPKSGSKSANVSKSSGKLKDDDKLAAKASKSKEDAEQSKSKQETPKSSKVKVHSSSVEKGKPNASGSKQKANDRAKEDKDKDEVENSMGSEEAEETPKLKATSSSKVRGSESKSNKKRRKA